MNRDNGPNRQDRIITTDLSPQQTRTFVTIDLTRISNNLSITKGMVIDNHLYFLATIEQTYSTYEMEK